jgi:DNA-binding NarL/FixJ family response regulator
LKPDPKGNFDIFFVDNDFQGEPVASKLVSYIRKNHPGSLIVAFSATLDNSTLKELIEAGCNGAYDKSQDRDLKKLHTLVDTYLNQVYQKSNAKFHFIDTLKSITLLIHEWNKRLHLNEISLQRQTKISN